MTLEVTPDQVSTVIKHPNGRLEVVMDHEGQRIKYGIIPGSRDRAPLHQALERLVDSGAVNDKFTSFVPLPPPAPPSQTPQQVEALLLRELQQAYDRLRLPLIDPQFTIQEEEARVYIRLMEIAKQEGEPPPLAENFPLLGATVGIDGDTLLDVANATKRRWNETRQRLGQLKRTYYQSWRAIRDAGSVDEKQMVFASVDWGGT